jgi:hypothetical protein
VECGGSLIDPGLGPGLAIVEWGEKRGR